MSTKDIMEKSSFTIKCLVGLVLKVLVGLVLKGGARGTAAAAAVGTQLPAPTNANIDPISKPPPFLPPAFSLLSAGQQLTGL